MRFIQQIQLSTGSTWPRETLGGGELGRMGRILSGESGPGKGEAMNQAWGVGAESTEVPREVMNLGAEA